MLNPSLQFASKLLTFFSLGNPMKFKIEQFMLCASLAFVPFQANAHGDEKHLTPTEFTGEDFEQKAWGIGSLPHKVDRTVKVSLDDNMRFTPDILNFAEGETVRFIVTNQGKLMHEFVLGTKEYNQDHAELMKRFPNMEHAEPHMAHVSPGETVELVWHFNQAGQFEFACLIAGHYDAGMYGPVTVTAEKGQP